MTLCVYFGGKNLLSGLALVKYLESLESAVTTERSQFPWWADFSNSTHLVKITSDAAARFQMTTSVHLQVLIGAKKGENMRYQLLSWSPRIKDVFGKEACNSTIKLHTAWNKQGLHYLSCIRQFLTCRALRRLNERGESLTLDLLRS